ncbi:cadherin-89D isoform X1 [Papilio machaon]|uniref:cadherin-89D isoform X1 n=1 Tax=Papilio machaon TaxID=76193 RepID=UPI001E663FFD|nr:cadherin-89D isoform X1 [Papilio machaon]
MAAVKVLVLLILTSATGHTSGCNFYPVGEYLKFVRIPENLKVGEEVLQVEVHPRKNLVLQAVDREEDAHLFTYRDVNRTHVAVLLAQSVDQLVDREAPQNVVKFRLGCDFHTGDDLISAYLSVTVYIEDVNDNAPRFLDLPYRVTVDELTPPGLTIFKGIRAFDRDKPNTPNSEVEYSITGGDPAGRFGLEGPHKPGLVLAKPIDYDAGDREFLLTITASDRGSPPRTTNATVHVIVADNDDLPPKFTLDVYRTKIPEFYPLLGKRIHKELVFEQAVRAFDQDAGVGAPLRYELISGDTRRFSLGPLNATLFLDAEIDLDAESLPGNTFVLGVQAVQVDDPQRAARARIEVEVLDLNDNLPEFEVDFYNISIVENLPNGFSVLQVMATDKDQGDNAEFTYQLRDPQGAFSIDPKSGWLTVRNQTVLDREQHSSLRMKVYAKEKNPSVVGTYLDKQRLSKFRRNSPVPALPLKEKTTYVYPDKIGTKSENIEYFEDINQLMSFVTVEVTLLDANDNNPVFVPNNLYEFTVKSNAKIGTFIGNVKAVDPDLGRNGIVSYDLQRTSNLTITSPFQVDANSGEVTVAQSPILEGRHALFVEASDQPANPSERRYSLAVVTVDVTRSNTDKPDFIGAPYEFWVGSNVGIGTSVGQIRVNEAMEKSDVSYDLLHGYEEGVPFAVEERSGVITVIHDLSKFNRLMYDFEAVAMQEGINLSIATNATIHVVDADDERGFLLKGSQSPITFHVKENLAGAMIGQIFNINSSSTTMNKPTNIRYIIANQQDVTDDIAIGQDGTIYAQKPLDREKRDSYRMTVIAEFNKGIVSGAGIYQVNIFVDDENDNPPIFDNPIYEGVITENAKKGTEVKMTNKIRATDADLGQNAIFSYTLFGDGHDLFAVNELSGVVTYVGNKLDREERGSYLLKVVARDKGSLKSEAKLTITVLDENDNEPKYNQIIIPLGESVDLLETHGRTDVKIFKEKKNDVNSGVAKIEVKPKNKFSTAVDAAGPLFLVPENIAIGSTILKLNAIDMDSGSNGQIRYEFMSEVFIPPTALSGNALQVRRYFVINERHGHIVVARALPPEAEFRLNVSAIDGGGLSDHITIRIFVKDINDHFPMFKKSWYSFNVDEAQYSRRVLGKVDATDADFAQNANLTYFLQPDSKDLPFEISPLNGVLSINGELDREKEDKYILTVVARDNGYEKKLTSSVSVEIEVLDVNDNSPKFYAYDELLEWKHPEADNISNHNFESVMMIPVYKTTLEENTPIGSVVTRVYANDSDLISNGNGLILYSLPQRKNQMNIFSIDSKEGIITTTGRLDYESQSVYNVTVVASDLGSPSLSSTAIVMLTVKDVPDEIEVSDKPVFISRYYELEIEENVHTPVELVTLNLTEHYENFKMRYFILNENDTDIKRTFVIDPRNGTLYLVRSPDREVKDVYEVLVRAERQKISRELPHMIYPVSDDVLEGMTKYDVKIVVRIKDVNDNAPKFLNGGRPMVTAIPTTAPFGYEVIQLQAIDADTGLNSDIRYQVMNSAGGRFAVSPRSGAVRTAGSFAHDAGKVFGFDVKATDRGGADDGRSAIANVFVYVLDESKQLILVVGAKPTEVEKEMENITRSLSNMTGYDIRVRRLEPSFKGSMDGHATDLYIYGVDPLSNAIIDMDVLQKLIMKREASERREVGGFKLLSVGDTSTVQARSGKLLSTMEIGVVALGCLVFIGACTTAVCILCVRTNKRKRHKSYSQQRLNAFSTEHLTKFSGLFPSGGNQCQEINQSYSEADSYIDVLNHSTLKNTCPHGNTVEEFGKAHQKCVKNQFGESSDVFGQKHERICIKYNQRPLQKRKGQDTSITSVNSSGQDSGIAEAGRCPCGHSTTHTSEESSGCSYEDSLKSNHNLEPHPKLYRTEPETRFLRRASFGHQPLDVRRFNARRQSFSENIQRHFPPVEKMGPGGRLTRQISTPNVNVSQTYFMGGKKNLRRIEAVKEPVVDYDQSEAEDHFDTRLDRRLSGQNRKRASFMELNGQTAVFVATPAAAEIMRRQGSERLMFARPL